VAARHAHRGEPDVPPAPAAAGGAGAGRGGAFRDSGTFPEGWRATAACAATLGASAILFQCPASFRRTDENADNPSSFFRLIDRPAGVRLL
jgi:hypothetical protein